jgi:hypothetical protein
MFLPNENPIRNAAANNYIRSDFVRLEARSLISKNVTKTSFRKARKKSGFLEFVHRFTYSGRSHQNGSRLGLGFNA